jgi:hypothetical protein
LLLYLVEHLGKQLRQQVLQVQQVKVIFVTQLQQHLQQHYQQVF